MDGEPVVTGPAPRPASDAPRDGPGRSATLTTISLVLIAVALGQAGGRVLNAPPSLSPNDASRWATVRALREGGTFAIGHRRTATSTSAEPYRDVGIVTEPEWATIDRLLVPATGTFYSTKPPLLPSLIAAESWLLERTLGWRLRRDRTLVARTVLLTFNWAPFALSLVVLMRLLDDLAETAWARVFVLATAAFGSFVTTFLVSVNNHTVAAAGALFAFHHVHRFRRGDTRAWRAAAAGALAGWTACNELPALLLVVVLFLTMWRESARAAIRWYLPAALVPIAVQLALNVAAFGDIVPAYARSQWYIFPGSYWADPQGFDAANEPNWLYALNLLAGHTGIFSLAPVFVLSLIGTVRALREPGLSERRLYALIATVLTVIVVTFYVFETHNYGGTTAAPRWFIWLTPLWLIAMAPAADRWAASARLRALGCVLLAVSVASVHHGAANPWIPSWLYSVLHGMGVVAY